MMTKEDNVRAILECHFTGFKDEIIDNAVKTICDLVFEPCTSPSQLMAKQAENFGEIAMAEIKKSQPCEDCISREELLKLSHSMAVEDMWHMHQEIKVVNVEDIKRLPSVQPQRKKGKWIPINNTRGVTIALKCSLCEGSPYHGKRSKFCPNCGADMRGDNE